VKLLHTRRTRRKLSRPRVCEADDTPNVVGTAPRKTRFFPHLNHHSMPNLRPSSSYVTDVFLSSLRTARPQTGAESLCRFRLGVTIGREKDELQDNWYLLLLNPYHNGHGREDITSLRKPKRLRSAMEVQLAKDVIDCYGGSGVAASLYYHRTGEVLDRRILHQLTTIRGQAVGLHTGSPAQSLIEDLRFVHAVMFILY
jgi:hypothetical protein